MSGKTNPQISQRGNLIIIPGTSSIEHRQRPDNGYRFGSIHHFQLATKWRSLYDRQVIPDKSVTIGRINAIIINTSLVPSP